MTDNTLDVARDLHEIQRLAGELMAQAYFKASDHLMPGGLAMVALGPVASPTAWEFRYEAAEQLERDTTYVEDEDDSWEPPLQTLRFWTEDLRLVHGKPNDEFTITTETAFLVDNLAAIHTVEVHWSDFAKDMHLARVRLEAILIEGERTTYGVQCPSCRAATLVRITEPRLSRPRASCTGHGLGYCRWPHDGCGDRGGLQERWQCPSCHTSLNLSDYESAVMRDYISHAPWLPAQHIERRTGVKPGTIRVWAQRGHVHTRRNIEGAVEFHVADIEARLTREVAV